jgi:type I restriction enzyme, S subunit
MFEQLTAMPKYEEYKDSGVEWLGEIPEHWNIRKLGFLGEFSASGIDKYIKLNESKVKIINFTDVYGNMNRIIDSSFNFMEVTTPEFNRIRNIVKKGDLIFLPSSETYEDLGLSALVNEDLDNTSYSYHVIRFRFQCEIAHSFRKYLTNNSFVLNQFSRAGKGTTRKIIGRNVFKNILVLIPLLHEQTSIAAFLDRKTAQIDQAVAIKEKQIVLLKERKQILIKNAVIRGLNSDVPMRDSGVDWIGDIPVHWEVTRLKFIFSETNERTKTGKEILFSLRMEQGLVPHDEVSDKHIADENLVDYKIVRPSQMVMNRMRAAIGIFGLANHYGLVSPDYAVFNMECSVFPDYFLRLFKTALIGEQFRLNSKGLGTGSSGFMRLYTENFGDIKVPLPSREEQAAIITYIETESIKINQAISLQQQQIDKLKEYKATLINSAVTGKIRVPELVDSLVA